MEKNGKGGGATNILLIPAGGNPVLQMWEWRKNAPKRALLTLLLRPELVSFLLKWIYLELWEPEQQSKDEMAEWNCPLSFVTAGALCQIILDQVRWHLSFGIFWTVGWRSAWQASGSAWQTGCSLSCGCSALLGSTRDPPGSPGDPANPLGVLDFLECHGDAQH